MRYTCGQVDVYVGLAREALAQCFDEVNAETARAYASMAFLYNMLGDESKFDQYIIFARNTANSMPPGDVPEDVGNIMLLVDALDMFDLEGNRFKERRYEVVEEEATTCLEAPSVLSTSDLCKFFMRADKRLGGAFYLDMRTKGILPGSNPHFQPRRGDSAPPGGIASHVDSSSVPRVLVDDQPSGNRDGRTSGKLEPIIDVPPPGEMSRKFAEEAVENFSRLESAANSPQIRSGIGGLYFNSIMAYMNAVNGSLEAAFEKIQACSEVLLLHPGLCRFTAWSHLAHCVLAVLVTGEAVENYEELRQAYNSVITNDDTPRAPPFEEWTSVLNICDSVFCRSLYATVRAAVTNKRAAAEASLKTILEDEHSISGDHAPIPGVSLDDSSKISTTAAHGNRENRSSELMERLESCDSSNGTDIWSDRCVSVVDAEFTADRDLERLCNPRQEQLRAEIVRDFDGDRNDDRHPFRDTGLDIQGIDSRAAAPFLVNASDPCDGVDIPGLSSADDETLDMYDELLADVLLSSAGQENPEDEDSSGENGGTLSP